MAVMEPSLQALQRQPNDQLDRNASIHIADGRDFSDISAEPDQISLDHEGTPNGNRVSHATQLLCKQSRADNSDAAQRSHWSRKVLLCLDGGGVRGYSSLLILQELMSIIQRIETDDMPSASSPSNADEVEQVHLDGTPASRTIHRADTLAKCSTSEDYPWRCEGRAKSLARARPSNPDPHVGLATSHETQVPTVSVDDFKVHHYFDYVVGTSTGGLSAIMLSRLRMTISKAIDQYDVVGNHVFGHPRKFHLHRLGRAKYNAKRMEEAVQTVVNNATSQQSNETPGISSSKDRALPIRLENDNMDACHTAVISKGGRLKMSYIFRSYDHLHPGRKVTLAMTREQLNPGPAHTATLLEVARATSAAPGYFEQQEINKEVFIDGGMGANNPTKLACNDIRQIHGMRPPILILSIGTGQRVGPENGEQVPESGILACLRRWKTPLRHPLRMLGTINTMENIVTDSEATHKDFEPTIEEMKSNDLYRGIEYFRFNVPNFTGIDLDAWEPWDSGRKTKEKLTQATRKYLDEAGTQRSLERCARKLVIKRQARAKTERWERFATDKVYGCPKVESCKLIPGVSRAELRQHSFDVHGFVWQVSLLRRNDSSTNAECRTPENHFMCIWDECGQVQPLMFGSQDAFFEHLRSDVHGIHRPQMKTRHQLEEWLDEGRTTPAEIRRNNSGITSQTGVQNGVARAGTHSGTNGAARGPEQQAQHTTA